MLGGARSGKSRHVVALGPFASARTGFVAIARTSDGDTRDRIARRPAERPLEWRTIGKHGLGEGTGAALGIGLARSAVAILAEMATFASAGVSGAGAAPDGEGP